MNESIDGLVARLRASRSRLAELKCLVGFDGYVDEIVRVVKNRPCLDECTYFDTIGDFADHVKAASGKSADMEIVSQETRIGGNGPILANALARLGAPSICVGALGFPAIHPVFKGLVAGCTPIGIAEPGHTDAFEFNDGKLMFGNVSGFEKITWEALKSRLGLDGLGEMVRDSSLIGVVNWSALHHTGTILEGLVNEILPTLGPPASGRRILAMDLADPSARSREDFLLLAGTLGRFSKYVEVVLCLNEKEARILACRFFDGDPSASLRDVCESIHRRLSITAVQIHAMKSAVGTSARGTMAVGGAYVDMPMATTGGGDNFNAGFLAGLLLGLEMGEALILGNAAAAYYVQNGASPRMEELADYIALRAEQGDFSYE